MQTNLEIVKDFADRSCVDFVEAVASKDPVPGGGSVAALVGVLGAALGNMVANLTIGKKNYADVQEEMIRLEKEITQIREELLELMQDDINEFQPLARLYKARPKTEQEKRRHEKQVEAALYDACRAPMAIMQTCGRAIKLSESFAKKGNKVALSDAAASAALCKAAMQTASMSVYINTNMMKDRAVAAQINSRCSELLVYYGTFADAVFGEATVKLMKADIEQR